MHPLAAPAPDALAGHADGSSSPGDARPRAGASGRGDARPDAGVPAPGVPGKLALSPGWLLFAALALAVPIGALIASKATQPRLPELAVLPDFSLTDQAGKPFGRNDLLGRVWIADFIFTSCADACPRLTQKLRSVQDRLTPQEQSRGIGLLSLSVDPERDTPAKLADYAKSFGARDSVWHFLTGPQAEVERTVVKGFRIAMAKMPLDPRLLAPSGVNATPPSPHPGETAEELHAQAFDILHGEKMVLVDARGHIRGYYDADDPGLKRLLRDARRLASGGA
jgi:protein SCO1/2